MLRECITGQLGRPVRWADLQAKSFGHDVRHGPGEESSSPFTSLAGLPPYRIIVSTQQSPASEIYIFDSDRDGVPDYSWCGALTGLAVQHLRASNGSLILLGTYSRTFWHQLDIIFVSMTQFTLRVHNEGFTRSTCLYESGYGSLVARSVHAWRPFLWLSAMDVPTWSMLGCILLLLSIMSVVCTLKDGSGGPFGRFRLYKMFKVLFLYCGLFMLQQLTRYGESRLARPILGLWLFLCMILNFQFSGALLELIGLADDPWIVSDLSDLLVAPFRDRIVRLRPWTLELEILQEHRGGETMKQFKADDRYRPIGTGESTLSLTCDVLQGEIVLSSQPVDILSRLWDFLLSKPFERYYVGCEDSAEFNLESVIKQITISMPKREEVSYMAYRPPGPKDPPMISDLRAQLGVSLDEVIIALREAGLLDMWVAGQLEYIESVLPGGPRAETLYPYGYHTGREAYEPLGILDFAGLWLICSIVGLPLAGGVLLLEVMGCSFGPSAQTRRRKIKKSELIDSSDSIQTSGIQLADKIRAERDYRLVRGGIPQPRAHDYY